MLKKNILEDITTLLRGFFATPMISSLGRLGVLEEMRTTDSFTVEDISNTPNKKLLLDTFHYFLRIGLLEREEYSEGVFRTSELGKEIFRRANSFYVPHSYFEYMYQYHDLIQDVKGVNTCEVERLENVIGSGMTHLRYFPPVISFLKRKVAFDVLVDIGCGDGQFLSSFLKKVPEKKIIGIDLSEISTKTTAKNLSAKFPDSEITTVCSNALDVNKWSQNVLKSSGNGKIVLSMWFLLHEISNNKPDILIKFFHQIHQHFPNAPIIIGEVVNQGDEVLTQNRDNSLLPEYLLIHEMSGQGILLWDEYREVLKKISYDLIFERFFDELSDNNNRKIPSTFIWCLVPR